ncbi:GTPase [Maribacter aestuarii]|uniref:GTPase n=1 Tax=Maribacter aestuarii TaxID=1130723 RepID=UPI0025A5066D|nr:GTPase [Maribacter aestuarii]
MAMKSEGVQKLILVYNADSGVRNLIVDGAHKILSPSTYACNLCDITFGNFRENKIWKKFRKQLEAQATELEFLHKDEFAKAYKSKFGYKFTFPIILVQGNDLEIFVSTDELNELKNAEGLIAILEERM